jgi:hypothetical protein
MELPKDYQAQLWVFPEPEYDLGDAMLHSGLSVSRCSVCQRNIRLQRVANVEFLPDLCHARIWSTY